MCRCQEAQELQYPAQTEEHAMTSLTASAAVLGNALVIVALGSGSVTAQIMKATDSATNAVGPAIQAAEREVIPGADGMSSAERDAYRRRIAAAATPAAKARIRAEYAKAPEELAPARPLIGDPARGAALHRACFACHGIERYVAPVTYAAASFLDSVLRASGLSDLPPAEPTRFKGRIQSLAALRDGVNRRNDYLNPKMTPQEIEDIIAYLNATYYNFPQ
jgi:mono/diheme cytochrome c family protein